MGRHVGVGEGDVVDHGESAVSQTGAKVIYRVPSFPVLA